MSLVMLPNSCCAHIMSRVACVTATDRCSGLTAECTPAPSPALFHAQAFARFSLESANAACLLNVHSCIVSSLNPVSTHSRIIHQQSHVFTLLNHSVTHLAQLRRPMAQRQAEEGKACRSRCRGRGRRGRRVHNPQQRDQRQQRQRRGRQLRRRLLALGE